MASLDFSYLKSKLVYLIEQLSSRPRIGGLQINNSSLEFVLIEEGKPRTAVLPLAPGILADGRLKDKEGFAKAIADFHQMIVGSDRRKDKVKAVVSLPAEIIFNQNFNIPNVGSDNLREAARLNLQMISPLPADKSYSDWQIINETPDRFELLGVLAEKDIIDDFSSVLIGGGFIPVAFEYPALSLARFVNKFINLENKSVLIIDVSSDGIDLFIMKNGRLYFDHFRSWHSIQGEALQITKADFENAIVEETQRVINFAASRFRESLDKVIVFAAGLEEGVSALLAEKFSLTSLPFQKNVFTAIGPQWFGAIGASLRGLEERSRDTEISLSSMTTAENFYQEQAIGFIGLWRNIFLTVGCFFLVLFFGVDMFLGGLVEKKEASLLSFNSQSTVADLNFLVGEAKEFNSLVGLIEKASLAVPPFREILIGLQSAAEKNGVLLDNIDITSTDAPVKVAGRAPNNIAAIQFKNDLSVLPDFSQVDLPFTAITSLADNSVGFNISFKFR